MQRTIPRSASIIGCAAVLMALAAGPAQAAILPYTATATAVTADSATLNGSIVSFGAATSWQFVYGSGPFVQTFSAGGIVAAGSPPSVPVLAQVTHLIPATTYTFQLIANGGTVGSTTSPLTIAYGGVLTFTTKGAGSASLTVRKLEVKKGRVALGFKCSSTIPCQGLATITTRHQGKRVTCSTAPFTANPGKKKAFSTKVSGTCRALVTAATPKPIKGYVTVVFASYQKTISKPVTLTLVP